MFLFHVLVRFCLFKVEMYFYFDNTRSGFSFSFREFDALVLISYKLIIRSFCHQTSYSREIAFWLLNKPCDLQNNNSKKCGGERVSYSSPEISMQRKISRKNVFVDWERHFPPNILFKRNLKVYYNLFLQSATTYFLTKRDKC